MVFTRRHSLPFNEWPTPDKEMWQALIAEGDILDGCGPGAAWASKRTFSRSFTLASVHRYPAA